jgi:hypothetical protein
MGVGGLGTSIDMWKVLDNTEKRDGQGRALEMDPVNLCFARVWVVVAGKKAQDNRKADD